MKRVLIILVIAVIAAGIVWAVTGALTHPPRPDDLTYVDPDVATAIERAVRTARRLPAGGASWARLGHVYDANGMDTLAAAAYDGAVRARPRGASAQTLYLLARVRERLGDLDGALSALDRADAASPDDATFAWRRGFWLLDAGRHEDAAVAFRRANTLDPTDPAPLFGLARLALARGDADAAVSLIDRAGLVRSEFGPYARYLLGTALGRLGEDRRARLELARAGRKRPLWRDPWTDVLGSARYGRKARLDHCRSLLDSGRRDEAIDGLERLADDYPDDDIIATTIGIAHLEDGRTDTAIRHLRAFLTRRPNNYGAWLNLAVALDRAEQFDEAIAAADRAIAANPNLGRAHKTRGTILVRAGRAAKALPALERAVELDARDADALFYRGMILRDAGDADGALDAFERAVEHDAGLVLAWVGLARTHLEADRFDAATEALANARYLAPDDPQVERAWRDLRQARAATENATP